MDAILNKFIVSKALSLTGQSWKRLAFVKPRTPMFGLDDVDPFPVPKSPVMMQERPSMKIPLLKKPVVVSKYSKLFF